MCCAQYVPGLLMDSRTERSTCRIAEFTQLKCCKILHFTVSMAATVPPVGKRSDRCAPCLPLTLSLPLAGSLFLSLSQSVFQVEEFKQDPSPSKCLHSVFHVDTGDEVYTNKDFQHLQVGQRGDKWPDEAPIDCIQYTHNMYCRVCEP